MTSLSALWQSYISINTLQCGQKPLNCLVYFWRELLNLEKHGEHKQTQCRSSLWREHLLKLKLIKIDSIYSRMQSDTSINTASLPVCNLYPRILLLFLICLLTDHLVQQKWKIKVGVNHLPLTVTAYNFYLFG